MNRKRERVIPSANQYSYKTVTSTQDIAREKALAGEGAGTVVFADFQTAGRGRQGRTWFAPYGVTVCMTVIGEKIALSDAWQMAIVAGVATAEAIRQVYPQGDTRLRFPNDLFLGERKLGGILIETVPHAQPGFVIPLIGIGVNVNIDEVTFPDDLRDRVTSLLRDSGRRFPLPILRGRITLRLNEIWRDYARGPFDETIVPRWNELRDPDARRLFVIDGEPRACRVLNVRGDGQVTLEDENGARHTRHAAHIILGDE